MKYKTLSVVAPAGGWIADGSKTIEVRSWICDIQPDEDLLIVENQRYLSEEGDVDNDGKAVAFVRVSQMRAFVKSDMTRSRARYFAEGYFSWELTNVRPIASSHSVVAARGIYEVEFLGSAP